MQYIPVHEVFHTWQGEGLNLGRNAYFIRTCGCPLHCPWCDSAGTWHKDFLPNNLLKKTSEELASMVYNSDSPLAVITGGEPAIHDLKELTELIQGQGVETAIETSGSFEIKGYFNHVTVSPKWSKPPLDKNVYQASELKIIVEDVGSISKWWEILEENHNGCPVWLHPEWSQRDNKDVLNSISEAVKQSKIFRAGYQMHKLYMVDLQDPNADKTRIPLGGNEQLGY